MSPATPRRRAFTLHLPHRALWIALGAFLAGLALFGIVWLSNRDDDAFYSVKPADKSGEQAAIEPLPEPLAAQDSASGMQTPAPGAQADAAQPAGDSGALPQPVLEEAPASASNAPAAQAATTERRDRVTPLPIEGQSPPPTYPPAALRRGETGTVVVRIQVDAQGRPGGVALIQSSRSRELDRAAMEAVRKWRFEPAIEDGEPVPAAVDIPVEFNLER